MTSVRIAVFGLGYVGLPLAVALARKFDVIGMDLEVRAVSPSFARAGDRTHEIDEETLTPSAR